MVSKLSLQPENPPPTEKGKMSCKAMTFTSISVENVGFECVKSKSVGLAIKQSSFKTYND